MQTNVPLISDAMHPWPSIMFGNIAGLYPKTNQVKVRYLEEKAKENQSMIIALTESHLKSPILDAEIHIPGYQLVRKDRQDQINKGGVIVYVKDSYAGGLVVLSSGCNGVVEWMVLALPKIDSVFVNVYRPPTCEECFFVEAIEDIAHTINKIDGKMPNIIMCGDYNMPLVDWSNCTVHGGTRDMQKQAETLIEFMSKFCLQQLVVEPTRNNNILDLFLTNNPDLVLSIDVDDTVVSDHRLLQVRTRFSEAAGPKSECHEMQGLASLNFYHKTINWEQINDELFNVNWTLKFQNKNASEILDALLETLLQVCSRFVPKKGERKRKSNIPKDRKILMRKRSNLNKKSRRAGPSGRAKIRRDLELIEFDLLQSHRREAEAMENRALNVIRENSKYFFSYAKSKSKIRVPVGPLEKDGKLLDDPQDMSELLQKQFVTVFSNPRLSEAEIQAVLDCNNGSFENIAITERDMEEAIRQMSSNAGPGPDGIPSLLLKKCVNSLSQPLALLWTESLATGVIPDQFKVGLITPVHKSGGRDEVKNYRPITLTSHLIKVFERVLVRKLVEYLESCDLLNNAQHGFRKNRSCLSQLMDHYQSILNIMESGHGADVIYLDFAKAFDKVDHGILMMKLVALGVGGLVLNWIHEFLTRRVQIVKVEGSYSCEAGVTSGVPQGTVLGPILFLLFLGDIDRELVYAKASSFADDTRVVMEIGTHEDQAVLQENLRKLYWWANLNNMEFNGGKFQHLGYGPRLPGGVGYLTADGESIEEAASLKDLGIIMSADANFDVHIGEICSKGKSMAGWIMRTFSTRETVPMITLFRALVLPIMEYCCQLWSPKKQYLIRSIESVQRNFTAKIAGTEGLKYGQRLEFLRMYSLERRRDRYTVIYVWKILQGVAPNMLGNDQIRSTNPDSRLGRYCILPPLNNRAPKYVQTLRENSFCVRGPKLFNELTAELRNFQGSLEAFKRRLDNYLVSVDDKPYDPTEPQLADTNSLKDQIICARLRTRSMPL